ncbi:N-acetylglucosamine-6-phosphate deacetylase [Allofustis seminis]|uniref:N-acetylglucosamine-6-phosphate deacetylase n=1 Tax=Allofustis seminis TaxID=166939 RepID=UPI0003653E51|nr:N-acetylglucosamine-6-phosphate deacetylase [Allofustis seminis]
MNYIKAKSVILDDHEVSNAFLEINADGTFGEIVQSVPTDANVIDYSEYIIAPGLVDTHIHGYHGFDVMDLSAEGIHTISEGLLECGVTSWLPTTLTDTHENINIACQIVAENATSVQGAKIQGIFLEGPFFTEKYKGAQNPKYMGDPSIEVLKQWQESAQGLIKKIAIAPERQHVASFIPAAKELGVYVSLAHSDATFEEAKKAVDAGANIFVHTYNGMSGLHHRQPGMVGAALSLDNVFAEVISDGHHVHPAAIKIIIKCRKDETILVTDCMRAGGIEEGYSKLGEFDVIVENGTARLAGSGNLAGSILELIQGVHNLVEWKLTSLSDAIRMASLNAAKSIGIDDLCGRIAPGYAADFIVIDEHANLKATYLDGQLKYSK